MYIKNCVQGIPQISATQYTFKVTISYSRLYYEILLSLLLVIKLFDISGQIGNCHLLSYFKWHNEYYEFYLKSQIQPNATITAVFCWQIYEAFSIKIFSTHLYKFYRKSEKRLWNEISNLVECFWYFCKEHSRLKQFQCRN